ncbi:hypothetical protein GVO57_12290 [Sphingomonas changnyeongensis]|uniref:Uncharacterized protein n=1 Tax=Sphingomonas changnyeongensis TaxID=2698679 RepID=A0A7Z2NX73_9SPHN|nr:hypothetical protein [Sphingomonas changnyeongensis]QHL91445.1 hypothetical protein GVO57_12290 [Sphingomonas changnyeongensis]
MTAIIGLALASPAAAQLTEQVDLTKPERPVPASGEAMIVLRAHASTMAGDNRILVHRYDPATQQVVTGPDGKPAGAKLTYSYTLFGGKKGEKALRVAIVPAGDYVLAGRTFNVTYTDSFCFGAPRFSLRPGEVVYLGDYEMLALEKMPDRERRNAMRYSADIVSARASLAAAYPALAPQLTTWTPANGATFRCNGDEFTAYAIPAKSAPALQD